MRPFKLLVLLIALAPWPLWAINASIVVTMNPTCNYPSGQIQAVGEGGVGPYTYLWNTGATTQVLDSVPPGTYSVTITDFNSEQATANVTLTGQPYDIIDMSGAQGLCGPEFTAVIGGPIYDGMDHHFIGPPPYHMNGQLMPEWIVSTCCPFVDTLYTWTGLPTLYDGWNTFTFSDGTGCAGTFQDYVWYPIEWPSVTILDIQGACSGANNGSITFQTGLEGHGQYSSIRVTWDWGQGGSLSAFQEGHTVGTFTSAGILPGDYYLRQSITDVLFDPASLCEVITPFTIPDLGPGCGNIKGSVFIDDNEDCLKQTAEAGVPGVILEIQPGPVYAITDNGTYSMNLPLGSYTIAQQSSILDAHCLPGPVPFTLATGSALQTQNVADTVLIPLDASVSLASGAARPGFPISLTAVLKDHTLTSTGPSTFTFTFDPQLSYLSSDTPPISLVGSTVTWDVAALSSFQEKMITVKLQVPPDINLLGTDLQFDAQYITGNMDAVPANNSDTLITTVTGSFDPNEKVAVTSSRSSTENYYIDADEWINYTIRFQNTGSDTAFNIVVTDTIPADLDLATFVSGAYSHRNSLSIRNGNVLRWAFYNIQLPDSNVNEPASHGFASFRIKPRLPLTPGTVIANTANIFFDFNDPVITEPSVLTAEFSTGIATNGSDRSELYPNPAQDQITISASSVIRRVMITSMDGRAALDIPVANQLVHIDLSRLNSGPYVLASQLVTGEWLRKPFIIARTQTRP